MTALTIDPSAYAYDVAVLSQAGSLLHLPRGTMTLEEQADELSATLRCSFPDVDTTEGHMRDLVRPGTPIYAYVVQRGPSGSGVGTAASSEVAGGAPWDPGWSGVGLVGGWSSEGRVELFRGTILEYSRSTDSIELQILAHDVLHTILKHEVDATVAEGTPFKTALNQFAEAWGLKLGRVDGPDANLPEHTWRGETAGTILADMLEMAMGEGGGHYVLRATGDALEVVTPGKNEPIYRLVEAGDVSGGGGAGITSLSVSITDLVGSVQIVSETEVEQEKKPAEGADKKKRPPTQQIVSEVKSDARFNGATKRVYYDKSGSQESAELEANLTLARDGFPEWRFGHTTIDIPMIRKYDKIAITDSILEDVAPLFVLGISHDASSATMSLTLQTQEDFEREGDAARLDAQLSKLRGEEKEAAAAAEKEAKGKGETAVSGDARQRILDKCQHVFGTPYVWGGPGGRSDWAPDHCNTDCSGFVTWLCYQLGAPTGVYAFTDNMAGVSELIASNSTAGAVAGDFVLQRDPSVQAGATYYHVQMYLGGGSEVVEDGGSRSPSSIGLGHILGGYEVRRFAPLYQTLHGSSGGKKK